MRTSGALFLIMLLLTGSAFAGPVSSGGGGNPASDEGAFSTAIMVIAVVGVAALLVGDLIFPRSAEEQPSSYYEAGFCTGEDTGVDWTALTGVSSGIPLLTVSVFPGIDGRGLAAYFLDQLAPGEDVYYRISPPPLAMGSIAADNAASVAFSHLRSGLFLGSDNQGLKLFSSDSEGILWSWPAVPTDSAGVREAAVSFREFLNSL